MSVDCPVSGLTQDVLDDVHDERCRQDVKHPQPVLERPDGTGKPGDHLRAMAAKRHTDAAAEAGTLTWRDVLAEEWCEALAETDPGLLRAELVQVAAVAVAWVEALDRRADQ